MASKAPARGLFLSAHTLPFLQFVAISVFDIGSIFGMN